MEVSYGVDTVDNQFFFRNGNLRLLSPSDSPFYIT